MTTQRSVVIVLSIKGESSTSWTVFRACTSSILYCRSCGSFSLTAPRFLSSGSLLISFQFLHAGFSEQEVQLLLISLHLCLPRPGLHVPQFHLLIHPRVPQHAQLCPNVRAGAGLGRVCSLLGRKSWHLVIPPSLAQEPMTPIGREAKIAKLSLFSCCCRLIVALGQNGHARGLLASFL